MGGSILPATIHANKLYFLFGKERDIDENPGWSDFGGGSEKKETYLKTACREGSEELTGFLGSAEEIKQLLETYGTYTIDYNSNEGYSTYRVHIFPITYDDKLPLYYNNNQRFLQKHLSSNTIADMKIFEKTQIKWFSLEEIKQNKHIFRSFYQKIVPLLLQNQTSIETFVQSKLHSSLFSKKETRKHMPKNKKTKTRTRKTRKTRTRKTKK